jgi:hypothetical protein
MKKFKKLFLLFNLVAQASILLAQQDSSKNPLKMKRGFYEDITFINGNFSKLNDILIQIGFPSISNAYGGIAIGISARPSNKDSYFTGKLFLLTANSGYDLKNPANGADIYSFGLHDEWHLDLVKNVKWRIGPDFGFGISILRLKLFERLNTPGNFAATLSPLTPTYAEKKLHSGSLFVNAGMGIDRKFKIHNTDFYMGVGLGYRLSTPGKFSEKYQYNVSTPKAILSGFQYDFKLRFELREIIPSKRELFRKFH